MNRIAIGLFLSSMMLAGVAGADPGAERLFRAKCAACHGADGKGATPQGKKMKVGDMTSAAFQKISDGDMTKAITEGLKREKDGARQEMKGFKDKLKPEEIASLVAHVRSLKK